MTLRKIGHFIFMFPRILRQQYGHFDMWPHSYAIPIRMKILVRMFYVYFIEISIDSNTSKCKETRHHDEESRKLVPNEIN